LFDHLRRLLRHSAAYTFASMLNRAFAILLVPIYTRCLSQDDYGRLSLLLGAAAIIWVLLDCGISASVTRFWYDYDDEHERRRLILTMWLTMMAVGVTVGVVLSLLGWKYGRAVFGVAFWPFVALTIWSTFFNAANVIPKALMRVREQTRRFVIVVGGQSAAILAAVLVFVVWLDMGLLGAVLAAFVQTVVIFLFFTPYTLTNAALPALRGVAAKAMRFGLPILALELGWWVLDTSDRFILAHYRTAEVVALYAIGYALGRLLIMLSVSIDQAWTPFFFARAKEDDAEARRLAAYTATYFALAVSAAGLLICVFAREAVLLFGGHDYLAAARVTPLIVVASVVQGLFYVPSRGLLLEKKTHVLPYVVAAAAIVNVGLNFVLIPRWGMMGAAFATVAGYAVTTGLTYMFSQRVYRIAYQTRRLATIVALLVVVAAGATLVQPAQWYYAVAWKAALLAAPPLVLWVTRFFEPREVAAVRRLLARRGPRSEAVT
jgi:O-antigen/teichoic acid export membrane protein